MCPFLTILRNNLHNNNHSGIYIDQYGAGGCLYNKIINNTVNNNTQFGIFLSTDCNNNTVVGNKVINNTDYGIVLTGCNDNLFYQNIFQNNGINAFDNGTQNYWDNGKIGNYWDNYGGVDADDDGIGDTPYNITGTANSQDRYPIWDDGDDINPVISLNSPTPGTVIGEDAPTFSLNITDLNLNESWYTINNTITKYFFTPSNGVNLIQINDVAWDLLDDGNIKLSFFVNDTAGNIGFLEANIEKDATGPIIIINSPTSGAVFGSNAPDFIITIIDVHLDSMWYTLDGGLPNIIVTPNGSIDQTIWAALSEGSITITFYANDTLGNLSFEEVTITKSITSTGLDPIIVIVIVSAVGGVALIAVIVIFMKKRGSPE